MDLETSIRREIAALGDLTRLELGVRWESIYRVVPPKGARRILLERAIAWQIQAKAFGALRKETFQTLLVARRIRQRAGSKETGNVAAQDVVPEDVKAQTSRTRRSLPAPGARLIRDWHGKTHVIDVMRDGYVWQGRTYSSLSVIAREITGARWSGPRFFGL
jgi:hypothetical protein